MAFSGSMHQESGKIHLWTLQNGQVQGPEFLLSDSSAWRRVQNPSRFCVCACVCVCIKPVIFHCRILKADKIQHLTMVNVCLCNPVPRSLEGQLHPILAFISGVHCLGSALPAEWKASGEVQDLRTTVGHPRPFPALEREPVCKVGGGRGRAAHLGEETDSSA